MRQASDEIIPGRAAISVGDPGTDVPEGWHRTLLTDIARMESGHTPSRKHPDYWDGDVPWVGIVDARLHHGRRIKETIQRVTEKGLENSAARWLPKDTVCLSRTASVGYVVILDRPMATSQDFVNWVCSPAIEPEFLKLALMAEGDHLLRFGKGSTHTTIYFPEALAFQINLPPIAEQRRIVAKVGELLEQVNHAKERLVRASLILGGPGSDAWPMTRITMSILTRGFAGELVPLEAELARSEGRDFESAEQLVARVKSGLATNQADHRGRGRRRSRRSRAGMDGPVDAVNSANATSNRREVPEQSSLFLDRAARPLKRGGVTGPVRRRTRGASSANE